MTTKAGVILGERSEPKDPGTDSTANVYQMRRFFDSANAPLRMTYLPIVRFDVLLTKTDKNIHLL